MKKIIISIFCFILLSVTFNNVSAQCQANFGVSDTSGTYYFADSSLVSGDTISSWSWSFGDLSFSTSQNPAHSYSTCGYYIVSLTISTLQGCNSFFTDTIMVAGNINGSFTSVVDNTTGDVQFTTSPNNVNYSYSWNFGDGNTASTANATNTYLTGVYSVCVIISDVLGACMADTVCDSVVVNVNTVSPCASTWNNFANGNSQTFTANPFGFGNTYAWDYGDGNTGTGFVTNYTYATGGTYTVCLTMTTGSGCVSVFCDTVIMAPPVPCALDFTWTNNGGGNYTFTETVTNGGIFPVIVWAFVNDSGTAFGSTPTYQFNSNGIQIVCAVLNPAPIPGCGDTICHILFVSGVGIDENPIEKSLKLFPNPAQNQFSIEFNLINNANVSVELIDLVGNKIIDFYNSKNQVGLQKINCLTADFAAGIYFVKVKVDEHVLTKKIIIH